MAKVTFKRVESDTEVNNVPFLDGQLIYSKSGKIFLDYGDERINVGGQSTGGGEWGTITGDIEDQTDLQNALNNKQNTISDLDTIRSGASLGATALQSYTETDPVFSASVASGITSTDINNWNNKSTFSGNYNDLSNKPNIVDYITEVSNNGTWFWRKWKSGRVELNANIASGTISIAQQSEGTYYGGQTTKTLPFSLSSTDYIGMEETAPRNSGVYAYSARVSGSTLTTEFRAHSSQSNTQCGVRYYIIGHI